MELVKSEDIKVSTHPAAEAARRWEAALRVTRRYYSTPEEFYYSPELVQFISDNFADNVTRYLALTKYIPPPAGLTLDDFVTFTRECTTQRDWAQKWYVELILRRSPVSGRASYRFKSLLEDEFSPKSKGAHLKNLNYLNEFLASESPLTFGEFMESELSEDAKARIERYEFLQGPLTSEIIDYGCYPNLATIGPRAQKRALKLLYGKTRAEWQLIIPRSIKHKKGSSFEQLKTLLTEVEAEVAGKPVKRPSLTADEIRDGLAKLIAGAVVRDKSEGSGKLFLYSLALYRTVPHKSTFEDYRAEYTAILALLQDEELTISEVVGLVCALAAPRNWLRGNVANYTELLFELIKTDRAVLSLLSELALTSCGRPPTEKEWRASMETPTYSIPADLFLTLTILSTAKNTHHGVPEVIKEFRGAISSNR